MIGSLWHAKCKGETNDVIPISRILLGDYIPFYDFSVKWYIIT